MELLSAALSAIAGFFGFARDRSKLKNAPPIVANVDAARDLKEKETIEKTVEKSEETANLDEERKQAAE